MALPTLNELHTALQSGSALLDGSMVLGANLDMRKNVNCLTLWREGGDGNEYPTHIITIDQYNDKGQFFTVRSEGSWYELTFLKAYNPFA